MCYNYDTENALSAISGYETGSPVSEFERKKGLNKLFSECRKQPYFCTPFNANSCYPREARTSIMLLRMGA